LYTLSTSLTTHCSLPYLYPLMLQLWYSCRLLADDERL
jgi:hypothetical protein